MTKILAYCAFISRDEIPLPGVGVNGAPVRKISHGALGLLWSEVNWPFEDVSLPRNAVEFHQVVTGIFHQAAVIPFRLLSVFDDLDSLTHFLAAHEENFTVDLERLHNVVQMECVLYLAPELSAATSGRDYLERKAGLLRRAEGFVRSLEDALGPNSKALKVRESQRGSRIFVLVERGDEPFFRATAQGLPVPERLARRVSGPWPAAEFLSDSVKLPQIAGKR